MRTHSKHTLIPALALAASLGAGSAAAEVAGNISVTNNYLWRGVTQTDDQAAVQGGLDYSHASGAYVGTWLSNVDFGDDTGYELDLYGGYGLELGEVGLDVGALYYAFPAGDDLDVLELYAGVSWNVLSAYVYQTVHTEAEGDEGDSTYLVASAEMPVPGYDGVTAGAEIGYWMGDDIEAAFGDEYLHWGVSVGKDGFSLAYIQNDIDGDDDPMVMVSWTKEFSF